METRNYLANASAAPPVKPGAPSTGYPQTAVPGVSEATVPGPFWFYKIGEELRAIITAAGLTPSDDNLGQLLEALVQLGLSQATETAQGLVELATAAEVQAGTDTQRAVTPARLASLTATETLRGLVELATSVEVQTGTDTLRAVTPAGLASFGKSHSSNGYQKLPGGLIVQWGQFTHNVNSSSVTQTAVTFPIAFPSVLYSVLTQLTSFPEAGYGYYSGFNGKNATGFTHAATHTGATGKVGVTSFYIALGK